MSDPQPLHATLVAYRATGDWRGVLLRGPSGAGKSALALRLILGGWRLVADDRVVAWASGGRLWGRAPQALKGLLEVRTIAILPRPALDFAEIVQVVDCAAPGRPMERIPQSARETLHGVDLPLSTIDARAPSAAEKVAALCGMERL